jgi:HSP20 family protein
VGLCTSAFRRHLSRQSAYVTIAFVAFTRWDPIRDLLAIQQRLDRFAPGLAGWVPSVDLYETPDHYVITAELPGITQEDVRIEMHDGQLTLSGVRRARELACDEYHRIERGHGAFSRTFQLPVPVNAVQVTADLRDGVLTVMCPKVQESAAQRIGIT